MSVLETFVNHKCNYVVSITVSRAVFAYVTLTLTRNVLN